tara:strand:- start:240 stop:407 length:168 start_codon:yes stop_codon:yes gene_type:complete
MKIGDLVRWKTTGDQIGYGIVMDIIDEFLVGVLWANSIHIYMESVDNLEVMNVAG